MLARLKSAIFSPGIPSALLAIGTFGTTVEFLHLIPENGTTERFSLTSSATTFRRYGATEQSRQQIGDITLHEQDLEALDTFVDDVEARARQLWKGSLKAADVQEGEMEATRLVQDVLRQRIELVLSDSSCLDEALQNLAAESLTVIHNQIERTILRRLSALKVKRGVRDPNRRRDFD
ncbi:hypothetical protein FQN54_003214 [Arachnomyces sp. PD_36]|nr:hypothetical protein FQN54_003214 [Arachnomyces sp. PD_36]